MTTIQFLTEWALRSSVLTLTGALLLWALRVKDPSVRLAAWTAMLCGSLLLPLFAAVAPRMPVPVMRTAPQPVKAPVLNFGPTPSPEPAVSSQAGGIADASKPFDWARAAVMIYLLVEIGRA